MRHLFIFEDLLKREPSSVKSACELEELNEEREILDKVCFEVPGCFSVSLLDLKGSAVLDFTSSG